MWKIPENERVEVTSENFGELLLESAREALAIARGEIQPARISTLTKMQKPAPSTATENHET